MCVGGGGGGVLVRERQGGGEIEELGEGSADCYMSEEHAEWTM